MPSQAQIVGRAIVFGTFLCDDRAGPLPSASLEYDSTVSVMLPGKNGRKVRKSAFEKISGRTNGRWRFGNDVVKRIGRNDDATHGDDIDAAVLARPFFAATFLRREERGRRSMANERDSD